MSLTQNAAYLWDMHIAWYLSCFFKSNFPCWCLSISIKLTLFDVFSGLSSLLICRLLEVSLSIHHFSKCLITVMQRYVFHPLHLHVIFLCLLLFFWPYEKASFQVRLIASVPGYHSGINLKKWGHMKIRTVLQECTFDTEFQKSPLVYQVDKMCYRVF